MTRKRTEAERWKVRITEKLASLKASREFFWKHVEVRDGCWGWTGPLMDGGYGAIQASGRRIAASRYSYAIHNDGIPKGLHVCHKCDNPPCCNPDHLFAATHRENMFDKGRKSRGRSAVGESNWKAVLSAAQVLEIAARVAAGEFQSEIAKDYGISRQQVSMIKCRKTWVHILGESA